MCSRDGTAVQARTSGRRSDLTCVGRRARFQHHEPRHAGSQDTLCGASGRACGEGNKTNEESGQALRAGAYCELGSVLSLNLNLNLNLDLNLNLNPSSLFSLSSVLARCKTHSEGTPSSTEAVDRAGQTGGYAGTERRRDAGGP